MTPSTPQGPILLVALELSNRKWKLTFGTGLKARRRTEIDAGDFRAFAQELRRAKHKLGLAQDTPVVSCYEAGRDGFWIHRALTEMGIRNVIVDPSSIEVSRRRRRAKTDRLDGQALLRLLARYLGGDAKVWSVVRVPSEAQEDARRKHRELERLTKEATAHRNRIGALLALHGIKEKVRRDFGTRLKSLRAWNGKPLGADLVAELGREWERLELARGQIREVRKAQAAELAKADEPGADPALRKVAALQRLKGVSAAAWPLTREFFGWRNLRNGREVGALAGLTGTPYSSGDSVREQGISKAGSRRVRALAVELAWSWRRHQPHSKLTAWYEERYGGLNKGGRRVGIVALARKLLVALWKYVEHGEVPEGATLKASA